MQNDSVFKEFRSFPLRARKYILMHTIDSPALIGCYMLPIYLLMLNYNVEQIGLLLTIALMANAILAYLVGKSYDKISAHLGLIGVSILECFAYLLYAIVPSFWAIQLGKIIENTSTIFAPAYPVYEMESFPAERREKIYSYHLAMPEITQIIFFPIAGYLLGYVFNTPFSYRIGFGIIAAESAFLALWIFRSLPKLERKVSISKKIEKVPPQMKLIIIIKVLLVIAWGISPQIILINYVINVLGKTIFEICLIEAMISIVVVLTSFFEKEVKKESRFKMIIAGLSLMAICPGIMILKPSLPWVIAAFSIEALGNTLWLPHFNSFVMTWVPENRKGEFFGAMQCISDFIGIFLPFSAGIIAVRITPVGTYFFSLFILMIVIIIFLFLSREKTKIY